MRIHKANPHASLWKTTVRNGIESKPRRLKLGMEKHASYLAAVNRCATQKQSAKVSFPATPGTRSCPEFEVKIKINVKGSGEECPLHAW
jgi:hypothetical protein